MASILIVEDDSLVAMGMKIYLESCGHDITAVATSAETAVSAVDEESPAVVLMDVRLKGQRDGVDAARAIMEHHDIPIIFVSGSGDPLTLERIRSVNPAGILLKPVTPSDLADEVARAVARQ